MTFVLLSVLYSAAQLGKAAHTHLWPVRLRIPKIHRNIAVLVELHKPTCIRDNLFHSGSDGERHAIYVLEQRACK